MHAHPSCKTRVAGMRSIATVRRKVDVNTVWYMDTHDKLRWRGTNARWGRRTARDHCRSPAVPRKKGRRVGMRTRRHKFKLSHCGTVCKVRLRPVQHDNVRRRRTAAQLFPVRVTHQRPALGGIAAHHSPSPVLSSKSGRVEDSDRKFSKNSMADSNFESFLKEIFIR